jgi:hypothetical protein
MNEGDAECGEYGLWGRLWVDRDARLHPDEFYSTITHRDPQGFVVHEALVDETAAQDITDNDQISTQNHRISCGKWTSPREHSHSLTLEKE